MSRNQRASEACRASVRSRANAPFRRQTDRHRRASGRRANLGAGTVRAVTVLSDRGTVRPAPGVGCAQITDVIPQRPSTTSARPAHHGLAEWLLRKVVVRPSRYGADESTALSPPRLAGTGNRRRSWRSPTGPGRSRHRYVRRSHGAAPRGWWFSRSIG